MIWQGATPLAHAWSTIATIRTKTILSFKNQTAKGTEGWYTIPVHVEGYKRPFAHSRLSVSTPRHTCRRMNTDRPQVLIVSPYFLCQPCYWPRQAGAGPVGLVAALALKRNGIPFRIVDKLQEHAIGQRGAGITVGFCSTAFWGLAGIDNSLAQNFGHIPFPWRAWWSKKGRGTFDSFPGVRFGRSSDKILDVVAPVSANSRYSRGWTSVDSTAPSIWWLW